MRSERGLAEARFRTRGSAVVTSDLVVSPGLVDAILAAVGLEFALLSALLARARASALVAPLLLYLGSGACLMLALRAALAETEAVWIAGPLVASFLAHALVLWQLYRLLLAPPRLAVRSSGRRAAGP